VVRRVRAGDAAAGGLWAALVQAAAVGVGNVAQLYSPEVIVIGGGLGRVGNLLLDPIREHLRSYGPSGLRVEVVGAALGDDAGLVGAAGWEEAFAPGKSSGA
jgi:glucokinase